MTAVPPDLLAGPRSGPEELFGRIDGATLRRFAPLARPHRRLGLVAAAAILAFVGTQLAIPALIRAGVDTIVGEDGAGAIVPVLVLFAAAIAANAAAGYASDVTAARLAQHVIFDLRRAMFDHLQRLPMRFMDRAHVGRIMARLQGDVNALQEFLETSIIAVGDLFLLVGITVVLFLLDWRLAGVTLLLLPALALVRARWLPGARETFARARDLSSSVNGALAQNIGGVRVVLAARREGRNLAGFSALADRNRDAQTAAALTAQAMVPAVDSLTGAAMLVVVAGGGWLLARGAIEFGVVVAFIFYVQRFFDPIRTVAQQYTVMQRAAAAARRIFEVLDLPVELEPGPLELDREALLPSVSFRNVTFGYRPDRPVIRGFTLEIAPHETVALVGPTGSGKSSVASLLRRLYDVWDGAVLIGGRDVRLLSEATLGRAVAMVLQEPFLFTGSVHDNIAYASGASREAVVRAARAVGADGFIRMLPEGYDTHLAQRGQSLSIGQRQLLSFARALVADPQILILDEATASIDSLAEAKIQAGLRALLKGRTSILIAHRLATVRDADRIVVLRDGAIVEQGSHAELLARGGLYADLCRHNRGSFDDANLYSFSAGERRCRSLEN